MKSAKQVNEFVSASEFSYSSYSEGYRITHYIIMPMLSVTMHF